MATGFCGWDIGGVHLKRSRLAPGPAGALRLDTAVVPFEIWKDPDGLAGRLRDLAAAGPAADRHAVTMTAELSDVFPTRAAGAAAVLDAFRAAFPAAPARVLDLEGTLVPWAEARKRPIRAAAANWLATARLAGRRRERALVIDAGSTTTDIVPVSGGRPAPAGRSDRERLASGELVYTGVQRTPPAVLAETVPVRGRWCRVAPEHFTIMADVYRLLGRLPEEAYTAPTPDGRGRREADAAARLARLVCSDLDDLDRRDLQAIAAYLEERQVDLVARAIVQAAGRDAAPIAVIAGSGAFLAEAAAARAGLRCERLAALFPGIEGDRWDEAAPSAALALLLAEEEGAVDLEAPDRGGGAS
jgi:probable H4MPT-linked C1 transfer pathway protein